MPEILTTTTMSPMDYNDIVETTTMSSEATTTEKPLKMLANALQHKLKDVVSSFATLTKTTTTKATLTPFTPITSTKTTTSPYHREHMPHQKITFEIPTHHDLEHIDKLHNFNKLLKQIGNVMSYDDASQQHQQQLTTNNDVHNLHASVVNPSLSSSSSSLSTFNNLLKLQSQSPTHQLISNAEISKSVVLDLADLKAQSDNEFSFERFFAGTDMHTIINYLWIGVVTSLIILSIIFIVFSCYFYRKFREWKKCNKDIRSQGSNHNNNYNNGELHYTHGRLLLSNTNNNSNERLRYCEPIIAGDGVAATADGVIGAAYYQIESPPCYTIATGLPSYDEALLHHHHHQQAHYYNYAFKFMYPRLAAKHQKQLQQQQQHEYQQQQQQHYQHEQHQQHVTSDDGDFIGGNYKKSSSTMTANNINYNNGNNGEMNKLLQYYNNNKQMTATKKYCNDVVEQQQQPQQQQQQKQQQEHNNNIKMSTLMLMQSAPPAYNVATTTTTTPTKTTSPTFLMAHCGDDIFADAEAAAATSTAATSTESIKMLVVDEHCIEICIDEQSTSPSSASLPLTSSLTNICHLSDVVTPTASKPTSTPTSVPEAAAKLQSLNQQNIENCSSNLLEVNVA